MLPGPSAPAVKELISGDPAVHQSSHKQEGSTSSTSAPLLKPCKPSSTLAEQASVWATPTVSHHHTQAYCTAAALTSGRQSMAQVRHAVLRTCSSCPRTMPIAAATRPTPSSGQGSAGSEPPSASARYARKRGLNVAVSAFTVRTTGCAHAGSTLSQRVHGRALQAVRMRGACCYARLCACGAHAGSARSWCNPQVRARRGSRHEPRQAICKQMQGAGTGRRQRCCNRPRQVHCITGAAHGLALLLFLTHEHLASKHQPW